MDGVSCPVSVFESNIGIVPLSFANASHVYPLGVARALFFDGAYTSSLQTFWRHDSTHSMAAMETLRGKVGIVEKRDFVFSSYGEDRNAIHQPIAALERLTARESEEWEL